MAKIWEGQVYLEPIEHVYIHRETGIKYTSVTKVLSSIEPHFDSESIAEAIVHQADNVKQERYIGMNKAQILDYWQMLNDTANEYGTYVHETIEEYLLNDKWFFPDNDLQKKVIQEYERMNFDEGQFMWPERIMFSSEYELAGTSDLIIDIDDVFFDVGDWKGLPIDTPIFTDSGWKTMGTLSKKDKVYDMNGNLTNILHLSSIKNKECYEIKFDNNETIVSDFEHRWLISFLRDKKFKDVVMTTEEIFNYLNELNNSGKRWSHKLPKIKIAKALNNEKIELPIDPYVLGVWLGDGHSVDSKITQMNEKVWEEIIKRGYTIGDDISQGGSGKATTRTIFGMRCKLRELSLISNKHLPEIYLKASYEQRLDVLRGFMDADGHYNVSRKRFVMSTTREKQAHSFNTLISSLGIKGTFISYMKRVNGKLINVYDICFSTDGLNPFLCRNQEGIVYGKQNNRTFKNIISVEKVDSVPTRCIEVESDTHTFLYGHTFSITHNTNREFNFFNQFGYKTLLKPFEHLQDCQYSIYSLQLSTYALMYEMEFPHRKCRQIWIGYWDKETETMSKIPVMYLKSEAKKLLNFHKFQTQLIHG
jgi:hypothetical protein